MNEHSNNDRHDEPTPDEIAEAQVTAYALEELSGDERIAFEARLEKEPALRTEVDSIRSAVRSLTDEIEAESVPALTDVQRERVVHGEETPKPAIFTTRRIWASVGLAAAACLALVVILPSMMSKPASSEFAIAETGAPADSEESDVSSWLNRDSSTMSPGPAGFLLDAQPGSDPGAIALQRSQGNLQERQMQLPKESIAILEASPQTDAAMRIASDTVSEYRLAVPTGGGGLASPDSGGSSPGIAGGDVSYRRGGGIGGGGEGGRVLDSAAGGRRRTTPDRMAPPAIRGREARNAPPPPSPSRPATPMLEAEKDARLDALRTKRKSGRSTFADRREAGGEAYPHYVDNPFIVPIGLEALSTLAIDVDTASYSNVRRVINSGQLPHPDAVRVEEMINYFDYDYEPASGEHPFSVGIDVNDCPWNSEHRLMRIGLKVREVANDMRPATNLVFLLDVSGSMNQPQKLPLVRESMKLLVDHLTADDRVAIVVYAGSSGLVLDSTYCDRKQEILDALDRLRAGGSTNGGEGIMLAYQVVRRNFIKDGVNRVILCTDGDFNVGVQQKNDLVTLIEQERESGVALSILGFGSGNWQDERAQALAEAGNGNAAYIDSIDEAHKVLVEEMGGTLVTVAKDVKLQVAFNPNKVAKYRLIGYASRLMAAQDFRNDAKDAGEIGAGHTVTFLYEIEPGIAERDEADEPDLVFQQRPEFQRSESDLTAVAFLRYKQPGAAVEDVATEMSFPVNDEGAHLDEAHADFQFASGIAAFGMLLRDSAYKSDATWELVRDLASPGAQDAEGSYRREFLKLVEQAQALAGHDEPVRNDSARPLTMEQISSMTAEQVNARIEALTELRRGALASGDAELDARFRAEFAMLGARLEELKQ